MHTESGGLISYVLELIILLRWLTCHSTLFACTSVYTRAPQFNYYISIIIIIHNTGASLVGTLVIEHSNLTGHLSD